MRIPSQESFGFFEIGHLIGEDLSVNAEDTIF